MKSLSELYLRVRGKRDILRFRGVLPGAGCCFGVPVTCLFFASMNNMQVPFRIPWAYAAAAMVLVFLARVLVPVRAYRGIDKNGSLAEKLKNLRRIPKSYC